MEKELYDDLFHEAISEHAPEVPETMAERVVSEAEQEFKGYSEEEQSRQNEEQELKEKLKKLNIQFRKNGNIKNPRMRHLNVERSAKRKKIRRDIEECKLRLQEIAGERQGAQVGSEQLVQASSDRKSEAQPEVPTGVSSMSSWNTSGGFGL